MSAARVLVRARGALPAAALRGAPRVAAPLLAATLLAGCAFGPRFETPRLSVTGVQIQSSDLWAQHLRVRMHVQNPNDRALPVRGLEYAIDVEGEHFASGESTASFVVPARGEADFDVSVTANLAGTLLKLLARPDPLGQSVAYRISGKLSLSEGLLRSIPFQQQGTFTLQ